MRFKKFLIEFTNMCPMAWEALRKTALMAFACAFCALMLAIHGDSAGGLSREMLHIKVLFAELPAGLFLIAAVFVSLLESTHRSK